jgi:hypothetical protein
MNFSRDRLGLAGVLLALISLAATILWPEKKWIGWLSLSCAVILLVGWAWMEFGSDLPRLRANYPILSTIGVFLIGGCLAVSLWMLVQPGHVASSELSLATVPACYVFPHSQVINGQLVLMIANQTKTPVDDLDFDITVTYSDDVNVRPNAVEWANHFKWGTCKALLTTQFSVPNKEFRISGHSRYAIWFVMTTRAEGIFRETIDIFRDAGNQFRAETKFYKATNTEPVYSQTMVLTTLDFPAVNIATKQPPIVASMKHQPRQDNSVHVGAGSKIEQQSSGDCSPNMVGGSNTVNCGPPPLVLIPSLEVVASDKQGLIKTEITIVPNQPIPAPFTIVLDFDNPISIIGSWVKNVASQAIGGAFTTGIHARDSVSTGISQSHPLLVTVYSALPVKLTDAPHIER